MAIDTTNLVYLIDPFWQGENNNGRPLVGGHMEVFIAGTDTKYITWQNWDGTKNPFKIPLGSDGRATILVEPEYTYDCYLYDSFNNLAVSRLNVKPNLGGDVYGLSQVYHDDTLTGNGTVTSPLGMVSAKLGVQEPLYFVEDDSATVIGLRESAYSGLPYVENSAIGYGMAGMQPYVSSISGLGFYALSANSASLADSASIAASAENAGLVTNGWETGSDGRITAYNGTAFSAGKVYSGISPVYVDNENDKIGVSSKDFLANSPLYFTEYSDRVELSISGLPDTPGLMYESGFNYESGKITGYNGSGISAGKVYSGLAPITVDNEADTISLASAILGVQSPLFFVEDSESATIIGVDTGALVLDIPESANWEEAYSTVYNNSASWTSAADELAVLNTGKWDAASDTLSSHSADWNSVNDKLDKSALELTGEYVSGIELSGTSYRLYAGWSTEASMAQTASFDSEGNYLAEYTNAIKTNSGDWNNVSAKLDSTASANFLTTADSSNFYTTANESGFITGVDLTDYATTAWVTGQGYLTGETDWTNTITAASAYAYSEATAQIPTALTGDYIETSAIKSGQISTATLISGFYDGQLSATYAGTANYATNANKAISASHADSARSAAYVYSGWGGGSLFSTESAINQYFAVTGTVQGTQRGIVYKFNAYSADSASVAASAERALKDSNGNIIAMTYLTANQPITASANWDSTYNTVSDNSASWTGGAGGGLPMAIGDSAVFDSGYEMNNEYLPALYLSGNMRNYPLIQVRGGYSTDGESGALHANFLSFHTGSTTLTSTYQVLSLDRYGLSGDAGYNGGEWRFRPYEYGLLTGTYDTVLNNSASWAGGGELPQSASEAIDVVTGGSANWNGTTETVSSNSASWGGSGIEISAGFGIDIQLVDNKLVISLATATGDI